MNAASPRPVVPVARTPFADAIAERYDAAARSLPDAGPGWLAERRRAHFDAFLRAGLPGMRDERWKYTSLRALERRGFALEDADAAMRPVDAAQLESPGLDGPRLVFVNGRFRADLSRLDALPRGLSLRPLSHCAGDDAGAAWRRLLGTEPSSHPADAFVQVNAALAADGVLLEVADGAHIEVPVQLVFAGAPADAALLANLHHLVDVGAGARLTLIEQHVVVGDGAGEQAHLANHVCTVQVGAGARLRHVRLQQAAAVATLVARTTVRVGAGGAYCPVSLELGAALSRHEWDVVLDGEGAEATLRGVTLVGARQQVDTRLSLRHAVGGTRSDTLWRAIAGGRARSAFHGGIAIDAGADGSDAALETKNLLLSDNAEIDAQPVLVIEADEVKASHGAAVGQLDAAALFYLRTRGIAAPQARALLIGAFCRAALAHTEAAGDDGALHALLMQAIDARLAVLEPAA